MTDERLEPDAAEHAMIAGFVTVEVPRTAAGTETVLAGPGERGRLS